MSADLSLRFVKTPGSVTLPDGVSRQYQVFSGNLADGGAPDVTFDLDQPHMRGLTQVRCGPERRLILACRQKTGAGRWELLTETDEKLAEIAGTGTLTQGWKLSLGSSATAIELVDPQSFGRQIIRTMLDGDADALLLTLVGVPAGSLCKRHRSGGGGVLKGLKRFVQGRDWVLTVEGSALNAVTAENGDWTALAACALTAIVSLELSKSD